MAERSRFGPYFLLPDLKGPAHRRQRIAIFSVLTGLLIFILCIPAIVVPLRHHRHSSTSSASSSSNNTNSPPTVPTQTVIPPPIAPVSFTPFPTPSDIPILGVFEETDPLNPPAVTKALGLGGVLPDFGLAWQTAKEKAATLLANFTLVEKVALTTGVGWQAGRCVGNIPAVQAFPGLCLEVSDFSEFWYGRRNDRVCAGRPARGALR